MRLSAENGCSARSTFDDPGAQPNPPRNQSDPPLEIEIWTMMQIPAGRDVAWGLQNIWASVWFEGSGAWPDGGELDAIEWCCPGAPEANMHNKLTGAYPNIAGFTQYNNNWPKSFYNNLIHIYVSWQYNKLIVYAGDANTSLTDMKQVAMVNNWNQSPNDKTNWFTGWRCVMDVKRYDSLGKQIGLNLWASVRTRGGS